MEDKSKLAKEGSGTFLGGVFGTGLKFLSEVVVARSVSISEFGIYGLCINIIAVIQTLLVGGARAVIQRYVPILYERDDFNSIKKLLLRIVLLVSVITPFLLYVLISEKESLEAFTQNDSIAAFIYLVAIAIPMLSMIQLLADVFRATRKVIYFNVIQEIIPGSIYLFFLGLIYFFSGTSLSSIFIAYCTSLFLSMLIGIYWVIKHLFLIESCGLNQKRFPDLLTFAAYSSVLYSIWILKERAAIFIVSYKLPADDVALYFVALRFLLAVKLIRGALSSLLLPRIAHLHYADDMEKLQSTYMTVTRWMIVAIYPIAIIISFVSGELALLVFGEGYTGITFVVMIILFFQVMTLFTGPSSIVLQMTGKPRDEIIIQLASAVVIILSCWMLIGSYNLEGVAVGVFGSMFIFDFLRMIYVRRVIGISPIQIDHFIMLSVISIFWLGLFLIAEMLQVGITLKTLMLVALLLTSIFAFYGVLLEQNERNWLLKKIRFT